MVKNWKMGKYILRRPDPQIIWPIKEEKDYGKADTFIIEVQKVEDNGF